MFGSVSNIFLHCKIGSHAKFENHEISVNFEIYSGLVEDKETIFLKVGVKITYVRSNPQMKCSSLRLWT